MTKNWNEIFRAHLDEERNCRRNEVAPTFCWGALHKTFNGLAIVVF